MALIKCPECGHLVSDKAATCPSCGVEIANNIIECPKCGHKHFKDQPCPIPENREEKISPNLSSLDNKVDETNNFSSNNIHEQKGTDNKKYIFVVAAIIICLIGAVFFYFYKDNKSSQENDAYEYAMTSKDELVLKNYLDTYMDAPKAHRDSILAHLQGLMKQDQDWSNTLVNDSKSAYQDYISSHPNSPHIKEATHKIDSIDWQQASNENTIEAYKLYLDIHNDGEYAEQANDAIKQINVKTVQPEEKDDITLLFKRVFSALNTKNEDLISVLFNDVMTSFLGKADATPYDVVTFMHKFDKDSEKEKTWSPNNDFKIDKKEIGTDRYEYSVSFSAKQSSNDDSSKPIKYKISAKVNPDGKISQFNMVKILE